MRTFRSVTPSSGSAASFFALVGQGTASRILIMESMSESGSLFGDTRLDFIILEIDAPSPDQIFYAI